MVVTAHNDDKDIATEAIAALHKRPDTGLHNQAMASLTSLNSAEEHNEKSGVSEAHVYYSKMQSQETW